MMIKGGSILIILFLISSISFVLASDVLVWQGQYYTGTTFNTGTYEFNFSVYDAEMGGEMCYSNTSTLTTGNFGEWRSEQFGVSAACNNASKDYYLNININGVDETIPRRRVVVWNFLRKDVNEITTGKLETNIQFITPVINTSQILTSNDELIIGSSMITQQVNTSGTARYSFQNVNSGNTSNTLFSVVNDEGYFFSFGLTSSDYFSVPNNRSFANQPSIGQSSFNDLYFVNGKYTGFSWLNNPFNDTSNTVQSIMNLESGGNLNVSGNITTTQTGFFGWLGSLTSKISTLFVRDIDASGNVNVSGNITLGGQIVTDNGCLIPHANFWAEENAGISAGGTPAGLEYAFGDASTRNFGSRQPCSGRVVYLTIQATNAVNGNGQVGIVINGNSTSLCNVSTPSSDDSSTGTVCNLQFNAGDRLAPRTITSPTGKNNGYLVSWWVVYD